MYLSGEEQGFLLSIPVNILRLFCGQEVSRNLALSKQTKGHLRILCAEVLTHFICVFCYIILFGGDNLP